MKRNKIGKDNRSHTCAPSGTKPLASGESCLNSRRKLDFKNKLPLDGKRIYLDLRGLKQRNVEDSLSKFGAIIEKFLSKEIHYFVTDQSKVKEKNDDPNASGSPSVYVSSPFNSGQTPSPSTFDKKALSVTRGRAMLQCVKIDSAPGNIVDKARKLGVKIVPYTSLMKWICKEKALLESTKAAAVSSIRPKTEENQKRRKATKLKYLKKPYIKFEAINKHYRPVIMEFASWPHISLSSVPGSCPFDEWLSCVSATKLQPTNKDGPNVPVAWSAESGAPENAGKVINKTNNNNNTKKCTLSQQTVSQKIPGRRLVNWERRKLAEKKLRQGFCECCDVRFDDIKKHLNSTEHCAFMKNETNYKQLDKLIGRGKAIHQFVDNIVSYSYNNSQRDYEFSESSDKVLLLSVGQEASRQSRNQCHSPTGHSISSCDVSIENVNAKNLLMKESDAQALALEDPQSLQNKISQTTKMPWKSPTRSPFKCLFNSPSRLDCHYNDKSSLYNKQDKESAVSVSVMTAKEEPLVSPSKPSEIPNKVKRHLLALQNDTPRDCTALSKSLKNSEHCLPPQLEKFPIPKYNKAPKSEKHVTGLSEQQKIIKCVNISPPILEKWDKLATNHSPENSPEANQSGVQMKRSFRSSSHKKSRSKRRRLFKLGEKWQVLSQQSVKKILFNDESPESFIGFRPQEIFKSDYSSDISFETVSEVLLTDHSDFEWTLGNSDGPFSEPSSQTADGHRTFFSWDSTQEGCPSHEVSVRHSPNTEKKSSPLTQIPEGGSTYTCSPTESVTRPTSTVVPNTLHSLCEDSPDKPKTTSDQKLCDKSVKYPTGDASVQHTPTPISIPIQSFPTPLIQDIQFPTHLNFQNLDSVASSVYNFNTLESHIPSQVAPPTSINTYNNLPCTDIGCLPNSTTISTVQSFQIFSPVFSCEDSELPAMPSVPDQVQLPQHVADFKPQDQNISEDSHAAVDFQNCLPPTLTSLNEQTFTTTSSFQSHEAPLNSTATYDPLPVLNFESSFNLPVQNFEMLPNLVTTVEVNTTFSPISTILATPLTAEASFSPSISTELPLQSQCNSAQNADLGQISETSVVLPDCLSDNDGQTCNVSNADHQHPSVQMTELAASSTSSSSLFDSSASSELNPSLTSEQQEVSPVIGFVSLSNFATSRVEDGGVSVCHDFEIQPSMLSHPTDSTSKTAKSVQKCKVSKNLCGFVTECQDSKQIIDSSSVLPITPCDLLSDYKSSHYSSTCSSDPQVSNSTNASKSESDTTDSLKLAADNTEDATSDETIATSDWNVLKNDSYADVKDSGFLSIEEVTPKKSPILTDSKSSEFSKKLSVLAKPCSVVLEKTDLLLAGFLHKALDKQNIFSVKRANNMTNKTPETVLKPRLLKRLSDTHKTFRLDYMPSGNTNRKFTPRTSTYKTRYK